MKPQNSMRVMRLFLLCLGLLGATAAWSQAAPTSPEGGASVADAASPEAAPGGEPASGGAAEANDQPSEPGAPTATPVAQGAADEGLRTADEAYRLKVRDVEGKINDLKEQIWRAKAKLTLLTEQVTGGMGTGASAVISHKNEMGGAFVLTEVHYFLDGAAIWQDADETGVRLTEIRDRQLFDGNLVEGSHTVTVNLVYRGNGSGVFSYLAGYVFRLKDTFTFTAEPGKTANIQVVGYERGDFTTEMTDRPAIKFDTKISQAPTAAKPITE